VPIGLAVHRDELSEASLYVVAICPSCGQRLIVNANYAMLRDDATSAEWRRGNQISGEVLIRE
jgi:hypothetical protein